MADNAIDKLFEKMRATAEELIAIQDEEEALQEQFRDLRKRHVAAIKHRDVLELTLKKHIHEKMPLVQAKMVAHEEIEKGRSQQSLIAYSSAAANAAGSASQAMAIASIAASSASQAVSIRR
ncbi:hypothetical protein N6H05_23945 [Sphingobium sp. WTD-1]|uniref:hypothetical protein n=1 Tax=Sphingobium sp. WTD-1 TaxID=2979467 RepID=UPI0024DEB9D7|nr:hypothetical protein [Sphingobium sp. WTD-1]WIA56033.1 hypothetical protein N6H05_23945 [Sphingobium sp. WTD-1]